MSRSWERKVRKNTEQLNKRRKKAGLKAVASPGAVTDRYRGRNYVLPALLILFIGFYIYMMTIPADDPNTTNPFETPIFWLTVACYLALAALFWFRRPYLLVGRDFVGTRKFTGDKTLTASAIKAITVIRPGYIIIEPKKGGNWVFSRMLNRYPIDEMADRLQRFAEDNRIPYTEQQKDKKK
ncbi:MAG: hypothetical protein C6W55_06580 [Thermobacillus sp.]|jgi:hypothetical protein|uniref:hypothetical protein n=1 Tax=Thermobacillus sp. TaxID=2108467 RepID=UPI000E3A41BF|nr:hypothetical protein [Thermobacillus sp.]REJ20655.1 MAG: hypothetical protein C6W59_02380 [Paenibacillaceae bacterium]REK56812.1 MAG: hypothetical protein C6W55_06580 [Thermobacillus sp.]